MNLTFYNNTGDIRQLNKNLTTVKTGCTVDITYEVSITDPVLVLVGADVLEDANYFYIAEWNRYYFITNRVYLDGNRIEITGHVDVLASFKNEILSSDCIAARSASNSNPYIIDNLCGDAGTFTTYYRRSSMTPFNSTGSYLLTVAGM